MICKSFQKTSQIIDADYIEEWRFSLDHSKGTDVFINTPVKYSLESSRFNRSRLSENN